MSEKALLSIIFAGYLAALFADWWLVDFIQKIQSPGFYYVQTVKYMHVYQNVAIILSEYLYHYVGLMFLKDIIKVKYHRESEKQPKISRTPQQEIIQNKWTIRVKQKQFPKYHILHCIEFFHWRRDNYFIGIDIKETPKMPDLPHPLLRRFHQLTMQVLYDLRSL